MRQLEKINMRRYNNETVTKMSELHNHLVVRAATIAEIAQAFNKAGFRNAAGGLFQEGTVSSLRTNYPTLFKRNEDLRKEHKNAAKPSAAEPARAVKRAPEPVQNQDDVLALVELILQERAIPRTRALDMIRMAVTK
jgi:hypothetical protein